MRTRVGYAGGTKDHPTYESLGDHTEAVEVDFDPAVISYEELLDVFWQSHSGTHRPWSVQYAAFVFARDDGQERLAEASRRARARELGTDITTCVRRLTRFWRAEGYHQKYRLRHKTELAAALVAHFGSDRAFVDSTAAARINGLLSGYGEAEAVAAELRRQQVPEEIVRTLRP